MTIISTCMHACTHTHIYAGPCIQHVNISHILISYSHTHTGLHHPRHPTRQHKPQSHRVAAHTHTHTYTHIHRLAPSQASNTSTLATISSRGCLHTLTHTHRHTHTHTHTQACTIPGIQHVNISHNLITWLPPQPYSDEGRVIDLYDVYNDRIFQGLPDLMAIDTITKIDACNNCLVQLPPGQFMHVCMHACVYVHMYTMRESPKGSLTSWLSTLSQR
jgi:hypothetical protein